MADEDSTKIDLTGALFPIVRQAVQHFAGVVLGAGVLSENEVATIAGAALALANLAWMLVARVKARQ